MRLGRAGLVALTFMLGCQRFGYDAVYPTPDAGHSDAGPSHELDSAVADASMRQDASALDGSAPDASAPDAMKPEETDASDPATDDAGASDDGGTQGSMDGGPSDAGSSGTGPCAITVVKNTYLGTPNFHGWLSLKNAGTTTWTTPQIRFDLPSSAYVCNDVDILPGAGWDLQSSSGHCEYTKTPPNLSIAPGETLDFEYSTNNSNAVAAPAAANVSVLGCPQP